MRGNGNHRRTLGVGLAAGTMALLLGVAAFAEPGPGWGPMAGPGGRPGPGLRLLKAVRAGLATVDLTDEQTTKIKALFETRKPAFESLKTRIRADAKALHEAANATTPDPTAVGTAFLKLKEDRADAKDSLEGLMTDIRAVLTPEQRTKLDAYLAALKHLRRRG